MALTLYNIKKWYRMLRGKSSFHVHQDIGKYFLKGHIRGYYNNLTEKVCMEQHWVDTLDIPTILQPHRATIIFPVAVFQYNLGLYDLFLQTAQEKYLKKFMQLADWSIASQDESGRWNNFFHVYPNNPYSAMAQGEGASFLIRAYLQTSDEKYIDAAKKAIDFMLKPVEEGGTTLYAENDIFFKEYTHLPVVLNGWIFAWWGLYDYSLIAKDCGSYSQILQQSCETIIRYLPLFNTRYWSKYDLSNRLTSPFYHRLHIAQMQAMFQLTDIAIFDEYANLWTRQLDNPINKWRAFFVKASQKILEKES